MRDELALRLAALRFMKEWSTWLVGIEMLLLGLLVSLLTAERLALGSAFVKGAAVCFGLSIVAATSLLASVPVLTERLDGATERVQAMALRRSGRPRWMTVGRMAFVQHLFFLLGLLGLLGAVVAGQVG